MMRHAVVLALILASPLIANACPCWPLGSTSHELERADAVFLGEVEKIQLERRWVEYPQMERRVLGGIVFPEEKLMYEQRLAVTIAVDRAWKGIVSDTVVLQTEGNSCDVKFEIGVRYLVFANTTKAGVLSAGACSATTRELGRREVRTRIADLGEPLLNHFAAKTARIRPQLETTDIVVERVP